MKATHPYPLVSRTAVLIHGVVSHAPAFKRWLTRLIPVAAEHRSHLLLSSLAFILLFWKWRPLGGMIWQIKKPLGEAIMSGGFASGWLLVLGTAFLLSHFDLFGLRQSRA